MVSNFKLGVGVPLSFHLVPSAFFRSFMCMEKPEYVYIEPAHGDPFDPRQQRVDAMRNDIVRDAFASHCTHLLMLDTDQEYPADTFTRLRAHKQLIVGARIRRRYPPFDSIMFRGSIGQYENVPEEECRSGKLIEVDATGTGCLLIDMKVFRTVAPPWFRTSTHNGRPVGEDFSFCSRVREAGIPIYVDTAVYVQHLTQMGVSDEFADLYHRVMDAAAAAHRTDPGAPPQP